MRYGEISFGYGPDIFQLRIQSLSADWNMWKDMFVYVNVYVKTTIKTHANYVIIVENVLREHNIVSTNVYYANVPMKHNGTNSNTDSVVSRFSMKGYDLITVLSNKKKTMFGFGV